MLVLASCVFGEVPWSSNDILENIYWFIGIISVLAAGLWKGIVSWHSLMSTYNIEVAFMTKKEQSRYNSARRAVLNFLLWVLYCLLGVYGGIEKQFWSLIEIIFVTLIALGLNMLILYLTGKFNKGEKDDFFIFTGVILVGMTINYVSGCLFGKVMLGWVLVFLVSIATTLVGYEFLFAMTKKSVSSNVSKAYYVDTEKDKKMYIFWWLDDKNCIVGDAEKIEDCKEHYVKGLDEIKKQTIYACKKKQLAKKVYKSVITENGKKESVEGILSELVREFGEDNFVSDEIEEVRIRIKSVEKKHIIVFHVEKLVQ